MKSPITLEQLQETCERLYERDGFVKWVDVGRAHGISRQAVQLRFRAAVEAGRMDQALIDRWQSTAARAAVSRERQQQSDLCRHKTILTPENADWLRREAVLRNCSGNDIINGLINKARG